MSRTKLIAGLPNSTALCWEILKWIRAEPRAKNPVILVPDNVWALSLKDDLAILAPEIKSEFLPALETDLLRNRGPSILRRMERIRFLVSCRTEAKTDDPRVFFVSSEALTQKIPSAEFWRDNVLRISKGEACSRTDLTDRLVELGYIPAELVETATEFAVRGSIVDIFPPLYEHPVRIELFDDKVQSLRLFHPESQRRIEDLDEVSLSPCREFFYPADEGAFLQLKSAFRSYLDTQDWAKQDRDALLDRIQQKIFFPTVDYWGPLIDPKTFQNSNWDFLREHPLIAVEAGTVENEFRVIHRGVERHLESAKVEGDWVPAPAVFLNPLEGGLELVRSCVENAELQLSCRLSSGFTKEPDDRNLSPIRGHDLLASKLAGSRNDPQAEPMSPLVDQLREWTKDDIHAVFVAPTPSQLERLQFLLAQYSIRFKIYPSLGEILESRPPLAGLIGNPQQGFLDPAARISFLLDEEIFGTKKKRAAHSRQSTVKEVFAGDLSLLDLKPGDLIVHDQHGVGRYLGLRTIPFNGVPAELVEIEYREGTKLLVPVTRLDLVHKHSGSGDESQIDRLGGQTWETKKAKVKKDLRNLAGELLLVYSKREMARGPEIKPDKHLIDQFAATFPYIETPDQAAAIEKTLSDMRGPRPMDRLICGDVGYGKTEVGMRAAHAALAAGWQVAVLVPTTILAVQHESTFRKRLEPLGFKVEGLSRFKSTRESKAILEGVSQGKVNVIVGTHRLLSSDLRFQKLGLLIVDEEQRFGVAHKEKIKKLRANVHILTLSATPIPRTLNMAMSGLKEISIINTPPADRLSVRTHVARKKFAVIQEAIQSELKRGGQVFYVHNRIQSMDKEHEELQKILPGVRIENVHGQMDEHTLEERMMNFYEGRSQVLLTTAIIESGLDIPNANTLIVDRADSFGLAQLYQIRGRVGRSAQRAYAYFLIPEKNPITPDAEERLAVLESYQELGSGFHIASHDLEIRGAGDLLGGSQSGHILSIGIDAYMELLGEAVAESRGEDVEHIPEPEINLGIDTTIPEAFIPEIGLRLMFYRKLAASAGEEEIDQVEKELEDRFGSTPASVKNLLAVMRIKCQLKRLGVRVLGAGKAGFSLTFDPSTPVNPIKIVESIKRYPSLFMLYPDGKMLIKRPEEGQASQGIMQGIEGALTLLESWCR